MLAKKEVSNILKNEDLRFEMVSIDILKTAKYQKGRLHVSRAKTIAKNFDPFKAGAILVSYRDGDYWILDGQHRTIGAKIAGHDRIMCNIKEGLTLEEEARFFYTQDDLNRAVSTIDKFEARLIGKEEVALKIKRILDDKGITISRGSGDFHISAVGALEYIYASLNANGLSRCLDLILETWDGENKSLQSNIMKGVSELIKRFGYEMEDDIFVKQLSSVNVDKINRQAKSATYHDDTNKGAYAKVMFEYHNKRLRSNKLSWNIE